MFAYVLLPWVRHLNIISVVESQAHVYFVREMKRCGNISDINETSLIYSFSFTEI